MSYLCLLLLNGFQSEGSFFYKKPHILRFMHIQFRLRKEKEKHISLLFQFC